MERIKAHPRSVNLESKLGNKLLKLHAKELAIFDLQAVEELWAFYSLTFGESFLFVKIGDEHKLSPSDVLQQIRLEMSNFLNPHDAPKYPPIEEIRKRTTQLKQFLNYLFSGSRSFSCKVV